MFVIRENYEKEYIINRSKFIVKLYKVNNKNNINDILKNIKVDYKDATHHCYAYILENEKRFSDNKEPSGTAGIPILTVLERKNLGKILCIVIRYFGGIKLGASGLTKAYSNVVTNTIKECNLLLYEKEIIFSINFSYENIKDVDYVLKDEIILKKEYKESITYVVKTTEIKYKLLKNILSKHKIKILP